MSSQNEHDYVDAAEFDDGNDYGDALVDDYQETEYDDLPLHADDLPYSDDDDGRWSPVSLYLIL